MARPGICLAALLAAPGALVAAPGVVGRVAAYVAEYEARLPALVADERYEQRAQADGERPTEARVRRLESEMAWIRLERIGETIGVREVRAIDGEAVASDGRLRALLEHPSDDPDAEIRGILAGSARYNLGPDQRNFNFPTFPLIYARRRHAADVQWKRQAAPDGRAVLQFREDDRRTIVRTPSGRPIRARGEFLVHEPSGRIERAELWLAGRDRVAQSELNDDLRFTYHVLVTFGEDRRLGLWLPQRMEEEYVRDLRSDSLTIRGRAEYANYRRYETGARVR